jgi:hypothetical protein
MQHRLNEKTLRDLAGPLSAADMTSLFHPAPFGHVHESPLQQISEDAAAAAVWDSFRSIDPDKERRVLEKWEQYNSDLRAASQRGASASAPGPPSPAAAALKSWSLVNKGSRAALRRANVHSVLVLETQLIELVELVRWRGCRVIIRRGTGCAPLPAVAASSSIDVVSPQNLPLLLSAAMPAQRDTSGRLSLQLEDPFGRLLVHGLAQFHGLSSFSGKGASAGEVTVHFRPEHQAQPEALPPPPDITW